MSNFQATSKNQKPLYFCMVLLFLSVCVNLYLLIKIKHTGKYEFTKINDYEYAVGMPSKNQRIATFIDKDKDGTFDLVALTILDREGNWIRDVIDYDFDGFA